MSSRARLVFLLGIGLVAAACLRLGFWQLERLRERRAANDVAAAARGLPELDLGATDGEAPAQRMVRATGRMMRVTQRFYEQTLARMQSKQCGPPRLP